MVSKKIRLYTIGFTGKTAEDFFTLLQKAGVSKVIDTRINNVSQLAGFAKSQDLEYFLRSIAGIQYEHNLDMAPTKELLSSYRDKELTWDQYEKKYIALLEQRNVARYAAQPIYLDASCFLCSEHEPDHCHRRLLAEYLQRINTSIEINHLM